MKKLFYLLLFLSLSFLLTIKANAALTGQLDIECDSFTKKVGESVSCTLYGNANEVITAVETTFKYNDGLTLINALVPSIWQGDFENNSLLIYTDNDVHTKIELLTFNLTSSNAGDYSLTFKDTYFTDSSFNRIQIANPNYTFKFISEEESKTEEEKTIAVIVDENNTEANNSSNNNKTVETEENPNSGAFIPVVLIGTLLITSLVIKFKAKKKIFKL